MILLSSCAQRAREAKGHQTVKIDTVVSADKQTFLQFPGKVKAAQDISLAFRVDVYKRQYLKIILKATIHLCGKTFLTTLI